MRWSPSNYTPAQGHALATTLSSVPKSVVTSWGSVYIDRHVRWSGACAPRRLQRRSPRPVARPAAVVGRARAHLGDVRHRGRPVPARRRTVRLGPPSDDPQRAQPDPQLRPRRTRHAREPAGRRRVHRRRRRVPVLSRGQGDAGADRLHRGVRPARLPDAHRPALPSPHGPVLRPVGRADPLLPPRPGHRESPVSSLVFVSVGTDHHPFDRLIQWIAAWLPEGVQCVVQHGTSAPTRRAEGVAYLDHGALTSLLDEAAVVVCHGGTTTNTERRRNGRPPFVLPRSPALGEHVDDHQLRFCARMETKGLISTAADEEAFHALLDRTLESPDDYADDTQNNDDTETDTRNGDHDARQHARKARATPVRY